MKSLALGLFCFFILLVTACNNSKSSDKGFLTFKDSLMIYDAMKKKNTTIVKDSLHEVYMQNFIAKNNSIESFFFTSPVPADTIEECIKKFEDVLKSHIPLKIPGEKNSLTTAITFNADKLRRWVDSTVDKGNTTEFRLRFGIYTAPVLKKLKRMGYQNVEDKNEGRITVFIWPFKNDQESQPNGPAGPRTEVFNLGGLKP